MGEKSLFDEEGFLLSLADWNETVAEEIAAKEKIPLTAAHWELIHAARAYHRKFDLSPEMRPLVKWVAQQLGPEKGRSIYLLSLFPESPAKRISKIAGLPKPLNCL